MDTPPYEPTDAEPTARPAARELRARADATTSSGDRTKKAVAVAAVASFLTAMGVMAVARSGATGSTAATTPTTAVSPSAGFDDGSDNAPTIGRGGDAFQPGAAQPAAPTFGRDDDSGDDSSSHGS